MALVTRLETGDREVTRRALNLLAQPQHAALSAKLLWQAADAMWIVSSTFGPHTPAEWLALADAFYEELRSEAIIETP